MVKYNRRENFEPMVEVTHEGERPRSPRKKKNKHEDDSDSEDDSETLDPIIKLKHRQIREILQLPAADHPGMSLVSAQLTGSNFLNWSRSIKRALAARSKLELLDGTFMEPDPSSKYYKKWLSVDFMVSNWIINSISKELVNAFNHIDNTYKLWNALNQRFGGASGPKILKLKREISRFVQGNLSVLMYFNQLNAMWDEMDMLLPPLNCTCAAKTMVDKREDEYRLLTFLIGLNDSYDATRTQIMLIKPLPNLDTAYSMVVQVEDQRQLSDNSQDGRVVMSMNVGKQPQYTAQNTGQGQHANAKNRVNFIIFFKLQQATRSPTFQYSLISSYLQQEVKRAVKRREKLGRERSSSEARRSREVRRLTRW